MIADDPRAGGREPSAITAVPAGQAMAGLARASSFASSLRTAAII